MCALVISTQQLQVFQEALRQPFAQHLADLAGTVAPLLCLRLGPQGTSDFVRRCLYQANRFGIQNENHIELLLFTMLDLGIDFDLDPQHTWAGSILHGLPRDVEYIMARDLYRYLIDFRLRVQGEEGIFAKAAFQRVLSLPLAAWTEPVSKEQTLRILNNLHPERFAFAGEASLRNLFSVMDRQEPSLAHTEAHSTRLLRASIMFLLGQAALCTPARAGLLPFDYPPTDTGVSPGDRSLLQPFLSYAREVTEHAWT